MHAPLRKESAPRFARWPFTYALLLLFFLSLPSIAVFSQEIVLKGKVLDAHSKDPVPFANVYQKSNPSKGVSADFDGLFEITFDKTPDTLVTSALGYETLEFLYKGETELTIELNSSSTDLIEVVVTADGEDPAYALMRKVVANKPKNNPVGKDYYSCEVYNKLELDFINITESFKKMKINKPFRFVFDHIDSISGDEPFLPMFITETISDFHYQKDPRRIREILKAVKVVGDYENESVGQLAGVAQQPLNPYDNWIDLVSKKFISPVADNGASHYRFYLIDSALIDNQWCYQVQFFPKHKGVNAFNGDLWVHDTTYAVKRIKLQLLEEGHLNHIEKLTILHSFQMVNDSVWMPERDNILLTTNTITEAFIPGFFKKLNEEAPGFQAKRTTTYEDFGFVRKQTEEQMNEKQMVAQDAFKKDSTYWAENRHTELGKSEKTAYFLVDTIRTLPVYEAWKRISTTLFTGFMWGDYVDIGNFYSFFSVNDIEGFRTKFGLRTSTKVSKKFLVGAYGAYGFGDKRFKYGIDFEYVFDNKQWTTLQLSYLNDYFPTPNFSRTFSVGGDGISSSYFLRRAGIPFKLLDVEHFSAAFFREFKSGFSVQVGAIQQDNRPTFNFSYQPNPETTKNKYTSSEAFIEVRYAFDEQFIAGSYERFSLGSRYPIVSLKYKQGFPIDKLGGDTDFKQLQLQLTDNIRWGAFGYTNWRLLGGKIWGNMPYLNMFIPVGNEGLIMNDRGFNLLTEYSFAADQYAWINLDHHFDGFLLQWVPLFRKLRVRAVANLRSMIGEMTDENRQANALNLFENTTEDDQVRITIPNRTPYTEASFGVENIFRFFRFDMIWRLNYPDLPSKRWGIRASVNFTL
ncbi:MAG: DUF5686 family protein [Bacteroidota bacterium]